MNIRRRKCLEILSKSSENHKTLIIMTCGTPSRPIAKKKKKKEWGNLIRTKKIRTQRPVD